MTPPILTRLILSGKALERETDLRTFPKDTLFIAPDLDRQLQLRTYFLSSAHTPESLPTILTLQELVTESIPYVPLSTPALDKLLLRHLIAQLPLPAEEKMWHSQGLLTRIHHLLIDSVTWKIPFETLVKLAIPAFPELPYLTALEAKYWSIKQDYGMTDIPTQLQAGLPTQFTSVRQKIHGKPVVIIGMDTLLPMVQPLFQAIFDSAQSVTWIETTHPLLDLQIPGATQWLADFTSRQTAAPSDMPEISQTACRSTAHEISSIVYQITEWIAAGTPPHQIRVLVSDTTLYTEKLSRLLTALDIPVTQTLTLPLRQTPAAHRLLRHLHPPAPGITTPDQFIQPLLSHISTSENGAAHGLGQILWEWAVSPIAQWAPPADWPTHIQWLLTHTPTPAQPPQLGGVHLLSKEKSAGMPCHYLICAGLVETQWPDTRTLLPYTDPQCDRLGMPNSADRWAHAYHQFQLSIAQTTRQVRLTYPKTHAGKETTPSAFLTRLSLLSPIQELDASEIPDTLWISPKTPFPAQTDTLLQDILTQSPAYRGQVDTPKFLEDLRTIRAKPVSVTSLERYQRCPYHSWFTHHLKLRGEKDLLDDVPAHIWGNYLHEVMEQFFGELKTQKRPLTHSDFCRQLLIKTAENLLKKYETDPYLWLSKRQLLFGTATENGLLDAFLSAPNSLFENSRIEATEHPFEWEMGALKISGKTDLILYHPELDAYSVVDFKSGSYPYGPLHAKNLETLQIPLELWALHRHKNRLACGVIYQLKDPKNIGEKILLATPEAKTGLAKRKRPELISEELFETLQDHVTRLTTAMGQGHFSYLDSPDSQSATPSWPCHTCDYKPICRNPKRYAVR